MRRRIPLKHRSRQPSWSTRMSQRSKRPKRSKTSSSAWSRTKSAIPLPCWAASRRPCSRTSSVALCRGVVARFQRTAPQRTLSFETPLEHLVAQVDPERIEQVVDNLLSNAIKYSPENGPVQVTLRESNGAPMASLSVADRGIGIPALQQARIFGRFERADNSRAYGIGGTGLGLYLSRAFVEQHGGRIWFESVEGQGSTFFIVLPLASESTPVPQQ